MYVVNVAHDRVEQSLREYRWMCLHMLQECIKYNNLKDWQKFITLICSKNVILVRMYANRPCRVNYFWAKGSFQYLAEYCGFGVATCSIGDFTRANTCSQYGSLMLVSKAYAKYSNSWIAFRAREITTKSNGDLSEPTCAKCVRTGNSFR